VDIPTNFPLHYFNVQSCSVNVQSCSGFLTLNNSESASSLADLAVFLDPERYASESASRVSAFSCSGVRRPDRKSSSIFAAIAALIFGSGPYRGALAGTGWAASGSHIAASPSAAGGAGDAFSLSNRFFSWAKSSAVICNPRH
jgi:hypothetical protein